MAGTGTLSVLMVTGAYHPEISSGGLQCQTMARALAGRATVRVLTTAVDTTLPSEAVVDAVPVTRVHIDVTSTPSRLGAMGRMAAALARLVPASDVVHIHGCSSKNVPVVLATRAAGRPVVLSLHTAGHDEPDAVKQSGRLRWWAFRSVDRYLSVSPSLVDAYLSAGLPADQIECIPNGIDTTRFAPADDRDRAALRQELGLPIDRPVVVFVGFFSHDKQPQILVDAWLRAHARSGVDATLVLVGASRSAYFEVDDEIAERIQETARTQGRADRLVLAGTTLAVDRYLRAADVFVLPSRREGLPVALLEAMACGLPCIASRLRGSTDAIIADGENGFLVPVGDVEAVATALTDVFTDRPRSVALGVAARQTVVDRYSSDFVAQRWLETYDHVTRRRA
jgi:glycosyltransferase involved in cell wall biosynthesis